MPGRSDANLARYLLLSLPCLCELNLEVKSDAESRYLASLPQLTPVRAPIVLNCLRALSLDIFNDFVFRRLRLPALEKLGFRGLYVNGCFDLNSSALSRQVEMSLSDCNFCLSPVHQLLPQIHTLTIQHGTLRSSGPSASSS